MLLCYAWARRAHRLERGEGTLEVDGPARRERREDFLLVASFLFCPHPLSIPSSFQHWQCLLVAGSGSNAVLLVFAEVASCAPHLQTPGSSDKCTILRGQSPASQSPISKLRAPAPAPQNPLFQDPSVSSVVLFFKPLISNNSTLSSLLFNP